MFEQLLGSKTRFRLLQLFLQHPKEYYYVRQLTRMLDTQINSVRRELAHLEKMGVLRSSDTRLMEESASLITFSGSERKNSKTKKKYFQIDPNFLLYSEMKAVFMKEKLFSEKDLVKNIKKIEGLVYVVLTGFFVGQEETIPTDMLIVGNIDRERLRQVVLQYEKMFEQIINYTVFTYEEYQYRLNINDRFLTKILSSPKMVVFDQLEQYKKKI